MFVGLSNEIKKTFDKYFHTAISRVTCGRRFYSHIAAGCSRNGLAYSRIALVCSRNAWIADFIPVSRQVAPVTG